MSSLVNILNPSVICPSVLPRTSFSEQPPSPLLDIKPELEALQRLCTGIQGPIPASSHTQSTLRALISELEDRSRSSLSFRSLLSSRSSSGSPPLTHSDSPVSIPLLHAAALQDLLHATPLVLTNVKINRLTTLSKLYIYGPGAIVEYPETLEGGQVGHLFKLDASTWEHPKDMLCYSLGDPKGATLEGKQVFCSVLQDSEGVPVPCKETHWTCQGSKLCPNAPREELTKPHNSASREDVRARLEVDKSVRIRNSTPVRAVFERTMAYKAALERTGCGGKRDTPTTLSPTERLVQNELDACLVKCHRGYARQEACEGSLILDYDKDGSPLIRCEHYHPKHSRLHFIDYFPSEGSVDIDYLEALFDAPEEAMELERAVSYQGYGPLAVCATVANFSSQRVVCPCDHRDAKGRLLPIDMIHAACKARFQFFTPLEPWRTKCPKVLMVCSGTHPHPVPLPVSTPSVVRDLVCNILRDLCQELPDATPRRVLCNPTVQLHLRQLMPELGNPTMADLHVSLANRDHLKAYIKQVKLEQFPAGTDWEGLQYIKEQQDILLPPQEHYIRLIQEVPNTVFNQDDGDEHPDDADTPCRFIICMLPQNSWRLRDSQYLQSDIAFRRVAGYLEFEMGSWDRVAKTSIIYCRVFLNRQTAEAHAFVFSKIDEIVRIDTGEGLKWRHIDSVSLQSPVGILHWTGDQHGGQAKGLGLHLVRQVQNRPSKADLHEPERLLSSLSPYEHLHRFFRLCRLAMRSLACVDHPDWEGTLAYIRNEGGKTGQDWIQDKLHSRFAFEGMCWSKSRIPLDIWQSGESNSNLIESVHADANREGKGCTLLGGVMKGKHFDLLKHKSILALETSGVQPFYKTNGESERIVKNVKRDQRARRKRLMSQDERLLVMNETLQKRAKALDNARKRAVNAGPAQRDAADKALVRAERSYQKKLSESQGCSGLGTGQVQVDLPLTATASCSRLPVLLGSDSLRLTQAYTSQPLYGYPPMASHSDHPVLIPHQTLPHAYSYDTSLPSYGYPLAASLSDYPAPIPYQSLPQAHYTSLPSHDYGSGPLTGLLSPIVTGVSSGQNTGSPESGSIQ